MAKRNLVSVYDVTTDTLYDSIAAAAKALGVDSSNLRKVIKGDRTSIAGHNFIEVGSSSRRQLKNRAKKLVSGLSPAQLERQAKARGEDLELLALQNDVYNLVRTANGRLASLKKKRVLEFSGVATDVLRFREILGSNSNGLLNGSKDNLLKLNKAELNSIKQALTEQLKRKSFTAGQAYGEANRIADIIGVRTPYAIKHRKILPTLWNVLKSVNVHGEDSDTILAKVADMMESGKTTKYIREFLETLLAYNETREQVFELFDVAKTKWNWIQGNKRLDERIIQLIKLQQLHPNSNELNETVEEITKILKQTRSKKAFDNVSDKLIGYATEGIAAAQLELGENFSDDFDNIITYADVLEFL